MAISPINFITNNPQGYGPGDLLGSIVEGYKAGRLPTQTRQAEAEKAQLIQQLMLGNQRSGIENQYLPNQLQQESEQRRLANEVSQLNLSALPQEIKDKMLERALANQKSQFDVSNMQGNLDLERSKTNAMIENYLAQKAEREQKAAAARMQNELLSNYLENAEKGDVGNNAGDGSVGSQLAENLLGIKNKEREAYQTQKGKDRAAFEQNINDTLITLNEQKDSLDMIGDIFDQYKNVINSATGRVDSIISKHFGKEAEKEFLGLLDVATGNLVMSNLKMFKGATSNKELDFSRSIKMAGSDTGPALRAKYQALRAFNSTLTKRSNLIYENIRKGMPQAEAVRNAVSETPINNIIRSYKGKGKDYSKMSDQDLYKGLK